MSRKTEKPFWDIDELQVKLQTEVLGKRLIVFNRITSTNDFLKRLARRGVEAGTLVLADQQTAGRGRFGRLWQSPPEQGLWFSFILRPYLRLEQIGALPLALAVIVAETLSAFCHTDFAVKWPNDILWNQRKVCGILCEAQISPELFSGESSNRLDYVVAGVGINVNQQPSDFHAALRARAISLTMITGQLLSRQDVFLELLHRLEAGLFANLTETLPTLLLRWRALCPDLGKPVVLQQAQETIRGVFVNIGRGGELVLKLADGQRKLFSAGEVALVKQ